MTTPTTATDQAPDLATIAADAERRLGELTAQAERISPEALTDEQVAVELRDIESEISACESVIRRAALAEQEIERRDQTAKAEAEQARKAKLIGQADKIGLRLTAAAEQIDQVALKLGQAVGEHRELAQRRHAWLVEAGIATSATRLPSGYDSATRAGFAAAGVLNALEPALGGGPLGPRPMIQPTTK